MFDGFKIQLVNSNHILEYDVFERTNTICNDIGVIHKTVYQYSCFSFHHYSESDSIWIHGSFHKYFNGGLHNYNNFNYKDFKEAVNDFLVRFSIDPIDCILKNVEYGVNVANKYNVNDILDCLLFHENKTPLKPRKTDIRFKHQRYELKIYNKSEHYKNIIQQNNILRVEVKFERMIKLNCNGLNNLSDLLNVNCLQFFNKELLTHWNNILMYDFTIDEKRLKTREKHALKDYKNPKYWGYLKPNQRHRPKQRLLKIIGNNSENVKQYISEVIKKTLEANSVVINN